MKSITTYFNQKSANKYLSLGFIKGKGTFVRVRNDTVQAFSLKYNKDSYECSVEFGIFPLCWSEKIFVEAGGYELDSFIVEQHMESSEPGLIRNSEDIMVRSVEKITKVIDLYLIPFFDKCKDCESSLKELIALEAIFEQNRLSLLRKNHERDCAKPLQIRSLFDSRKYYMALKAHNLPYALQYLNQQIDYYMERIKTGMSNQPEVVKKGFLRKLEQASQEKELLVQNGFKHFDEMLRSNEVKNLELLKRDFPSIVN